MSRVDSRAIAMEKVKMDMTPMIDVVFLLIIFFMCTIKFKILEGKIPAYLPKDVGVNTSPIDELLDKIDIRITRVKPVDVKDKKWVWDESQIQIRIGPKVMSGLKEFHDTIKVYHQNNPEAKATFSPDLGTYYIDSVKVINECLRADFKELTFKGVPLDS